MRKKLLLFTISIFILTISASAQNVGINSTGASPAASAGLDVSFTDKGVLIPRVDISDLATAAPVSSPATSLLVYNTNTTTGPGYFYWDGSKWVKLFDINDGKPWLLTGNAGTTAGTNFLGTTDAQDFVVKTNNAERMRVTSGGFVGINTTPTTLFDVDGGTSSTTQTIATITGNSLTSGKGLLIESSSLTSGYLVDIEATNSTDNSANTNAGLYINNTGPYGNAIQAVGAGRPNYSAVFATSTPIADGTGYSVSTSNHTINSVLNGNHPYSFAIYGRINNAPNPSGGIIGYYASDDLGIIGYYNGAKTGVVGIGGTTTITTLTSGSGGAFSSNKVGVFGYGDNTDYSKGVYGYSANASGYGVYGKSDNIGVFGYGNDIDYSYGVYGYSANNKGTGVIGYTSGAIANGIYAKNGDASGTGLMAIGNGVTGSYLTNGTGIAVTGNDGVYAKGTASDGTGVIGVGNNSSAINTITGGSGAAFTGTDIGVAGWGTNSDGSGGYFTNGNGSYAYVGTTLSGTNYKINGNGSVSTIVKRNDDTRANMFCPEAPEILFQDYGEGKLVNGKAHIDLDPILTKNIIVNDKHPLRVFIQLEGDCNGVYVSNKSQNGFDVVELQNGNSNVNFSWTIVANRADEFDDNGNRISKNADVRFPDGPGPMPIKTLKEQQKKINRVEDMKGKIDNKEIISTEVKPDKEGKK